MANNDDKTVATKNGGKKMVGRLLKLERIGDGSPKRKFTPYCKKVLGVYSNGFVKTEEMKPNRDYSEAWD